MTALYVCAHSLELLTRAVAAYKPGTEDQGDYDNLRDYLRKFTEEEALLSDLSPADIPF